MRPPAKRDIDWDYGMATVSWSILGRVALDELTMGMLRAQVDFMRDRAALAGIELLEDAYVFSDAIDGSEPWRPGSITLFFARLRERVGLEHLDFHYLRKFMETYGQNAGFSPIQVAHAGRP